MSSNEEKAKYRFFPWVREGYRPQGTFNRNSPITESKLKVDFTIQGERRGASDNEDKSVTLDMYGPGEIVDINEGQIARIEPEPRTPNFPPNYFPIVEFDRMDLPWLFTPVSADEDGRLPPWLCLVVVRKRDGVSISPGGANQLPVLEITDKVDKELPDLNESWAWAHAQTVGGPEDAAGVSTWARREFETDSIHTRSRLIAPRRLDANQSYHACVVPTFEAGVQAGLGQRPPQSSNGMQKTYRWAWDLSNPPSSIRLPVYYTWEFTAGAKGDFKALVRELEPQQLENLGDWELDVTSPGPSELELPDHTTVHLKGALRSADRQSKEYPETAKKELAEYLNRTFESSDWDQDERPAFGPPAYGIWHIGANEIADPAADRYPWLSELNLEPSHRVAAGLGTAVVQENQEQLMASAWDQLGAVRRANELLSRARLAREASATIYDTLVKQPSPTLLSITWPLHNRVFWDQKKTTVRAQVEQSRVPEPILSSTLRRILRPRGPLRSRLTTPSATQEELIRELNDGYQFESPEPPYDMKYLDWEDTSPDYAQILCESMQERNDDAREEVSFYLSDVKEEIQLESLLEVCYEVEEIVSALSESNSTVPSGIREEIKEIGGLCDVVCGISMANDGSSSLIDLYEESRIGDNFERSMEIFREIRRLVAMVESRLRRLRTWGNSGIESEIEALEQACVEFNEHLDTVSEVLAEAPSDPLAEGIELATCRSPLDEDVRPELNPAVVRQPLEAGLDPETTIQNRISARVHGLDLSTRLHPLDDIMAAPQFDDPMYLSLKEISEEHLLPGVGNIPKNSLGVLETNPEFVESFMVGANHEMARELRWRKFPTDMRGTYFERFWDRRARLPALTEAELDDIKPIHSWRTDIADSSAGGPLGGNHREGADPDMVVFVVRGELLRRYPKTSIYAVKATEERKPSLPEAGQEQPKPEDPGVLFPEFRGEFEPDITFLGFDLGPDDARGKGSDPGWFFVLEESPGEPEFGLDVDPRGEKTADADAATNNSLIETRSYVPVRKSASGGDDGTGGTEEEEKERGPTLWGKNSAHLASTTWQQPVRTAVHANDLLPQEE